MTVPCAVSAAQFDYSVYTGIEHSNNITLSQNNPISQNVLIPGVDFTYQRQGSTFQANIIGALEYRDYLGSRFDNQTQTELAAQTNWTVLPKRLDFAVEDYAGIQPVDSLASNSPTNQQQTNVLVAGPTLHVQFGNTLRGQLDLRYINSYASRDEEFNSSRVGTAARLFRDVSPTDQVSANVEFQRVDFSNATGANYDRYEAYVGYASQLAMFDADILLGGARLNFDDSRSYSSPLARATLGWRPTAQSTFSLSGAYQYADAAQDMMIAPGLLTLNDVGGTNFTGGLNNISGIGTGSTVIDSQVYEERLLQLSYAFTGVRTTLSITPAYRKLDYLNDATFNQVARDLGVTLGYRLRPNLVLTVFGAGERLQYQSFARTDNTIRYGVDLSRQWTRHWSWHASVIRQRQNSDAPDQSYRETQIFFSVVYRR
ncbi:MAG: outer membrane beta-barrel protein [Dyella sp.]